MPGRMYNIPTETPLLFSNSPTHSFRKNIIIMKGMGYIIANNKPDTKSYWRLSYFPNKLLYSSVQKTVLLRSKIGRSKYRSRKLD